MAQLFRIHLLYTDFGFWIFDFGLDNPCPAYVPVFSSVPLPGRIGCINVYDRSEGLSIVLKPVMATAPFSADAVAAFAEGLSLKTLLKRAWREAPPTRLEHELSRTTQWRIH
jgi:hypothetical protein